MSLRRRFRNRVAVLVCIVAAIGAAPASARTVYVSETGNDANDGLSWAGAKRTVQAGLNKAVSGDHVWVAAGTYVGCITLKANVALWGGFAGTETNLAQRDWVTNKTILDGDKAGSVVVSPSGLTATARIDGFTIRNGIGTLSASSGYRDGGGIHVTSSSPTIANNTITANTIVGQTNGYGGGICCLDASPTIVNNTIAGNSITVPWNGYGGGIYWTWSSSPTITNNTITGNTASYGGGICDVTSLPATIENTIVAFNSSGIYSSSLGILTLRYDCVFGNTAYNFSGVTDPTGTNGNISADPLFTRQTSPGPDGIWGTADDDFGDLRLRSGSPCIDAGDNARVPADMLDLDGDGNTTEPLPFDILRGARFVDDPATADTGNGTPPIVDMGAYEYIPDCNGNGVPDTQEPDEDGDGTIDACDGCPADPMKIEPGICGCGVADTDEDGDGVADCLELGLVTDNDEVVVPEGGSAVFRVKLATLPPSDISVSISEMAGGDADLSASPPSLTFTPLTWDAYQTVTVTAAEDPDAANGSATIRCSASGTEGKDVTATEQDNDTLAIATDKASLAVPEGATASFQVKLTAQPLTSVVVELNMVTGSDSDITISSPSPTTLAFTSSNWSVYQTVTLSAAEDADAVSGQATVRLTASNLPTKEVTVLEQDSDLPPIITDTTTVSVPEGGTATFQVKLDVQPSENVTVKVLKLAGGDPDIAISSPVSGNLTFTLANWSIFQTVTLTAAEDVNTVNSSALIRCSAAGFESRDITATEADNDTLSIVVDQASVTVAEGGTGLFRVKLSAQPLGNLEVVVAKVAGGDPDISATPASLVFTIWNWNEWRTVTLSATEDADTTNGLATIRCSASGLDNVDVMIAEEENDTLSVVTDRSAVSVSEGGSASFGVKLNAQPVSDVTISVNKVPGGDPDVSVLPASLTFTTSNWDTYQAVIISAGADADYVNGEATIRCSAAGLADKDVAVTEADQGPPATTWYRDMDSDGYGNPNESIQSVGQPGGYVSDKTDCSDNNASIHPGATDTPDDGIDQDCSGSDATTIPPPGTDADGDGVPDATDTCPATPTGSVVDGQGCAAAQRDTDSDGVMDDEDQCADTPAGAESDAHGCAASQRDSDGDGVIDADDQCAGTPTGAETDTQGCAASQRDSDNDGITDDVDQCPQTPSGTIVEADGCPADDSGSAQLRPSLFPFCGTGIVESVLFSVAGLVMMQSRRKC